MIGKFIIPALGREMFPVKRDDIYFEINHDQESVINQPRPHVGINNLYFSREDVDEIMQLLNQAPGITEGVAINYEILERGVTETIQFYLNLMESFKRSKDGISATVKMVQSLDWMDGKVDAFTYESLYNSAPINIVIDNITYSSYKDFFDKRQVSIPYVISTIPNWHDAFLALFGLTYIGNELYKGCKQIIQWASPSVGLGASISALALIIEITFVILLIVTLIALIAQLINCLIQPIKYHGAMLMVDLLKITAFQMGLTLKSSIYETYPFNQIAYLPEKYQPIQNNASLFNILGFNVNGFAAGGYTSPQVGVQHGYFNGVGGDFLRMAKRVINGKIIIPDQTSDMVLERRDFYPVGTPYSLPDVRQDWNGYNTDELFATMILRFADDLNERNCIDNIDSNGNPFYTGTILQATHQQNSTNNPLLVCLKGLREINIPCARGVQKTELTFVEQAIEDLDNFLEIIITPYYLAIDAFILIANAIIVVINILITLMIAIIDLINTIIDAINWIPGVDIDNIDDSNSLKTIDPISFINPFKNYGKHDFSNRINAWLFENDYINTPKLLMIDVNRSEFINQRIGYAHIDNRTTVNAEYLWDNFYKIDAFVGTPNNRFTKINPALNKESDKNRVAVSLKDFKNLVSNPKFLDNFGEVVIADSLQWYPEQNGATDFQFRKAGWLNDPQNPNGAKRAKEIFINLNLITTLPDGQ